MGNFLAQGTFLINSSVLWGEKSKACYQKVDNASNIGDDMNDRQQVNGYCCGSRRALMATIDFARLNHSNFLQFLETRNHSCMMDSYQLECFKGWEGRRRDWFSLNYLLSAHVREGCPRAAWLLFHQMHRMHLNLNPYTSTPIFGASTALSDVKEGQQVHALVIKTGSESETVTKTALVDMYSKFGLLGDSVHVFEDLKSKDAIAWNTMLSGFLRTCASLNALKQGKQIYALVIVLGNVLVVLDTALVDLYSICGLIGEAMKKFDEVFMLIRQMKPNCIALTSVLAACSEKSDLSSGKQVHCLAIHMYAKCGKISASRSLFDRIPCRCVVSLDQHHRCIWK
ncbi:hypothetical protein NE237_004522 [Protea cynaroides]|uniref:Pentatricopeptide repeat-containing protein n=1 Tax=Protea cynaroides TaxID=273540 RepID=A0A9Q0KIT0_9MAGN|nr:hypothetical protein NE237_004522 [Protea cynaroides]